MGTLALGRLGNRRGEAGEIEMGTRRSMRNELGVVDGQQEHGTWRVENEAREGTEGLCRPQRGLCIFLVIGSH